MKNILLLIFLTCFTSCKKASSSGGNNHAPVVEINIDVSQKFQTMQGFGGFGAQDVYWSNGPFTSASFVNDLINDLGLTILRDNIPTDFEDVNDDNDPHTTTLSNFHYNSLNNHLQYLKDMKAAGLQ